MPIHSLPNRREIVGQFARVAVLAAAGTRFLLQPSAAVAQDANFVTELMAPGALPDVVQGSKDAPVTIVEYASMTCTHCAKFHAETYPTLKSKYIDTGKVKLILREFPLDPLATAAFMLARAAGSDERRTALVDLLFDKQQEWAFVDKPIEALAGLVKQAGISQQQFEDTLKNKDLYDKVNQMRDRAGEKFGVDATPTFFINGKKVSGEMSVADLEKLIDPLVKS
jgi:protein-disulfide isomerase